MEEISVPLHPGFTVTNMEGDTTSSGGWRGDAPSRFSLCVYFYGTQNYSHLGLLLVMSTSLLLCSKEVQLWKEVSIFRKYLNRAWIFWLIMSGSVWLSQVGGTTATTKILLGVSVRLFSEQLN